jgi:hypothetical protein
VGVAAAIVDGAMLGGRVATVIGEVVAAAVGLDGGGGVAAAQPVSSAATRAAAATARRAAGRGPAIPRLTRLSSGGARKQTAGLMRWRDPLGVGQGGPENRLY